MLVEIIATNVAEAILAERYGANRIELIHSFDLGGLTPDLRLIRDVCAAVTIPVNVMVRPHEDSFVFSSADMLQVFREIDFIASNTSANGIVFGTLTKSGLVDFDQLEAVLTKLEGTDLKLTFHRAIDESSDPVANFKYLVANYSGTKLQQVLTSGGAASAILGQENIRLMNCAASDSIQILAGAGINPNNARELVEFTGVKQIHLGTGVRSNNVLDEQRFKALHKSLA